MPLEPHNIQLLLSENLRAVLPQILEGIIETHISHRLADDFLILTPDSNSANDLAAYFLNHSRLDGVLTGKSILSAQDWMRQVLSISEPHARLAPEWVHERALEGIIEKRCPDSFKKNSCEAEHLKHLILTLREEAFSVSSFHRFLSSMDAFQVKHWREIYSDYVHLLKKQPLLYDRTQIVEQVQQMLQKGETNVLKGLKNIYWLGWVSLPQEIRNLIQIIGKHFAHLSQTFLLQKPFKKELQDWIQTIWGEEGADITLLSVSTPGEKAVNRFSTPFEEAGWILAEAQKEVEDGTAFEEICITLPADEFWQGYFFSELEKLGLARGFKFPKPLSYFKEIQKMFSMPLEQAHEETKDLISKILLTISASPHPSLFTLDFLFALQTWQEKLEEALFYQHQFPDGIHPSPSSLPLLEHIAHKTFSNISPSSMNGITLRKHSSPGLKTFKRMFVFGMNENYIPQFSKQFGGMPIPQASRDLNIQRAQFQHLMQGSNQMNFSFACVSAQAEIAAPSVWLEEFHLGDIQNKTHPILFASLSSNDHTEFIQHELHHAGGNKTPSPYAGFIQNETLLKHLRGELEKQPLPPTALERYANCPFKFFASRLLKLKGEEDPTQEGSNLERGNWLHGFLQLAFETQKESVVQAIRNPNERNVLKNKIPTLVKEFSEKFLQDKPWIHVKLADDFQRRLTETTCQILEDYWERMEKTQEIFYPAFFEFEFGNDQVPPLSFSRKDLPDLKIRGRIDRVDVSEDGKHFIVFDYKSGDGNNISRDIKNFKSFQLPLYLLAMEKQVHKGLSTERLKAPTSGIDSHSPTPSHALGGMIISMKELKINQGLFQKEATNPWSLNKRGSFWFAQEEWHAYFQKLNDEILNLYQSMLSGDFRTRPDPCDPYCDFATLCRYHARPHS